MNLADSQPAPALLEAFDAIIAGLCQVMATQCGKNRFIAPICVRLWARLLRTTARLEVLFIRWRAGQLPASRPRPNRAAAARKPQPYLPRAFGWLLKLVPPADAFGALLQHLLTDPEMLDFLTEVPQAGRLLRPLCNTLGVKLIPPLLRPKTPKPAPPEKPPTAETPTKKAPPEIAKNPDPGASLSHAGDPLWARPVSIWCNPPRPKT
jgi:hypothetical protein